MSWALVNADGWDKEKSRFNTGESIIFSGREDNIHRHGVAIMMTKKAEQALLEWKPISDRIIYASPCM